MRLFLAVWVLSVGLLAGCDRPAEQESPYANLRQGLSTTLADCHAATLIAAIEAANAAGAAAHSNTLSPDCTYTLTAMHNGWYGHNGLPAITSDLTIIGQGRAVR